MGSNHQLRHSLATSKLTFIAYLDPQTGKPTAHLSAENFPPLLLDHSVQIYQKAIEQLKVQIKKQQLNRITHNGTDTPFSS